MYHKEESTLCHYHQWNLLCKIILVSISPYYFLKYLTHLLWHFTMIKRLFAKGLLLCRVLFSGSVWTQLAPEHGIKLADRFWLAVYIRKNKPIIWDAAWAANWTISKQCFPIITSDQKPEWLPYTDCEQNMLVNVHYRSNSKALLLKPWVVIFTVREGNVKAEIRHSSVMFSQTCAILFTIGFMATQSLLILVTARSVHILL